MIEFIQDNSKPGLEFHYSFQKGLSNKQGGVGLARKIGMDEALRRASVIHKSHLPIVCLDADCRVSENYFQSIHAYYKQNPQSPGASIYFEHELEKEAISYYELFLRYYVNALRFIKFPYAYHTVGSSMSVRALEYAMEGGMNRRKAGEDFYFIHKIIPRGGFGEINNCKVYPSSRRSDRVPFGTGRAMIEFENDSERLLKLYNFKTFEDLKTVLTCVDQWYINREKPNKLIRNFEKLPEIFKSFFEKKDFLWQIEEARDNSSSEKNFLKRIFQWLDAFTLLKIIHHARDHFYPNEDTLLMANQLLMKTQIIEAEIDNVNDLLKVYRKVDQKGLLLDQMRNI